MAWTTPKTWSSAVLTSADMNAHLRDNLNAMRVSQAVSYAQKTTATSFGTTPVVVCTVNYTFDSSLMYVVQGCAESWTSNSATTFNAKALIKVGGNTKCAYNVKSNGATGYQDGFAPMGVFGGSSGVVAVTFEIYSDAGSGHILNADATAPVTLTLRPLDVA